MSAPAHRPAVTLFLGDGAREIVERARAIESEGRATERLFPGIAQALTELVYPAVRDAHLASPEIGGAPICGSLAWVVVFSPRLYAWIASRSAVLDSGFLECVPCLCARGKVAVPCYVASPSPRDYRLSVITAAERETLAHAGLIKHVLTEGSVITR